MKKVYCWDALLNVPLSAFRLIYISFKMLCFSSLEPKALEVVVVVVLRRRSTSKVDHVGTVN